MICVRGRDDDERWEGETWLSRVGVGARRLGRL